MDKELILKILDKNFDRNHSFVSTWLAFDSPIIKKLAKKVIVDELVLIYSNAIDDSVFNESVEEFLYSFINQ